MKWIVALLTTFALSASGANLLPNASFELFHKFWAPKSTEFLKIPVAEYWTNSPTAQHGTYSIALEMTLANSGTQGRGFQWMSLPFEIGTNKAYNLSAYYRQSNAGKWGDGAFLSIRNPVTGATVWSTNSSAGMPTGSWGRLSMAFTNGTATTVYQVEITAGSSSNPGRWMFVDAVQLEEGSSATAFDPWDIQIGFAISTDHPANLFFVDDDIDVPLNVYNNTGSTTNITVDYAMFDHWNALVKTGSVSIAAASGLTATNIDCSVGGTNGHFMAYAWLRNIGQPQDEISVSIVDHPPVLSSRTNGIFGTHVQGVTNWAKPIRDLGLTHARSLVSKEGNMNVAEPTDDNFAFYTDRFMVLTNLDLEPVFTILSGDIAEQPAYAVSGTNFILSQLTNYTYRVVSNYYPTVTRYEMINEPVTEGEYTPDQYRLWMTNMYDMIKLVNSNIIAIGIVDHYTNQAYQTLSVGGASNKLDIYATHIYDYWKLDGNTEMIARFNLPGWNTESGTVQRSRYQTPLWEYIVDEFNPFTGDNDLRAWTQTSLWGLKNWAHTAATNITKFFYYDARQEGGPNDMINYSLFDWDQTLRPIAVLYSGMAQLAEESVKSSFVNLGATNLYCEVFEVGADALAVAWTENTTNLHLLTSSLPAEDLQAYDQFANPIAYGTGVRFSNVKVAYLKATGTDGPTLAASLGKSDIADAVAPNASIITAPIGTQNSLTNFTFRWVAADEVGVMAWSSKSNAITFRWGDDGVSYGAWSHTNKVFYPTVANEGTFYLQARDPAGNIETTSWTWPFTEPVPPVEARATFSAGILTGGRL